MKLVFYFFYNVLITLALPVAWVVAYFNDKLGSSLSGQKEIFKQVSSFRTLVESDPKPVIWTHAASAGEFEQMRPLLTRLSEMDVYIFQTLTSSTIYYKVSHEKTFDGVCFLPWDVYPRVNRFIKLLQPTLFINTRHDIWPNLLLALNNNQIRNILINANLYSNSFRLKPGIRVINRLVFNHIDKIYTGSESLKSLLERLYDKEISVIGDSRFDQVSERAQSNHSELISYDIIADRTVIVYGSVIQSDLAIVTEAIAKATKGNTFLHVIVPHETNEKELIPWEVALYRHKFKSIRKTEIEAYNGESVLIWNSVGQLADLYKYAQLAYIGAGFGAGVHSVTEASIYNVPAAHGPKYDILAEAIDLVDEQLSSVVHSSDQLSEFLSLPSETISALSISINTFMSKRIGATDTIIKSEFSHTLV